MATPYEFGDRCVDFVGSFLLPLTGRTDWSAFAARRSVKPGIVAHFGRYEC